TVYSCANAPAGPSGVAGAGVLPKSVGRHLPVIGHHRAFPSLRLGEAHQSGIGQGGAGRAFFARTVTPQDRQLHALVSRLSSSNASRPARSPRTQTSAMRSPSKRKNAAPSQWTGFPVGSKPRKEAVCRPENRILANACSPSATQVKISHR